MLALLAGLAVASPVKAQPGRGLAPQVGVSSGMDSKARSGAQVAGPQDQIQEKVRWEQKMNSQVPLDLEFKDSDGQTVTLGKYFATGKPVVLSMIFYNCTMMCSEVMNGEVRMLKDKDLGFKPGRDFEMVTVSIHPRETPELAAKKKKTYLSDLGNSPDAARGWHLLTGRDENIKKLAAAVGYHYTYDASTDQYAHPGGLVLLTPKGHVARYLNGIDYPGKIARYALIEASQNRIGSPLEKLALFTCFHYNPSSGTYSLSIMRLVQMAAIATMLGLAFGIGLMRKWEDRARMRAQQTSQSSKLIKGA
jgi:protein SCO1/2